MTTSKKPTPRSRFLGLYIQVKSLLWISVGIAMAWGFATAGELGARDALRSFAFFLVLFLVPALLLWVLGVLVRIRNPLAWWFAVGYLALIVILKASVGSTELPLEAWSWTSTRLPPFYLKGFATFAAISAIVLAADVAALASFVSPVGRACFGVGAVNKTALEEVRGGGE